MKVRCDKRQGRINAYWLFGVSLLAAVLASCWTHYIDNSRRPYWQSVFKNNKTELDRFLSRVKSGEHNANENGKYSVPQELIKARILSIQKQRGFLLFTLRPQLPDDPVEVLAADLDDRPSTAGVRALISLVSDRLIYHIQYVEQGWYYCMYN
jgi:hypothetical protein